MSRLTPTEENRMAAHPPRRLLGAAVRLRRTDLGLSLADVANRLGPSSWTLARLERYEVQNPRADTLRRLDRALRWWPGTAEAIADGRITDTTRVEALVTAEPLHGDVYGRPHLLPHDRTPAGFTRWDTETLVEA